MGENTDFPFSARDVWWFMPGEWMAFYGKEFRSDPETYASQAALIGRYRIDSSPAYAAIGTVCASIDDGKMADDLERLAGIR
ncbi:MAG: hypothetical protein PHR35_08840 [Kiritimatiellae bacterium]|nr:hypothetical protein [Kiritimatiellia bacterium]